MECNGIDINSLDDVLEVINTDVANGVSQAFIEEKLAGMLAYLGVSNISIDDAAVQSNLRRMSNKMVKIARGSTSHPLVGLRGKIFYNMDTVDKDSTAHSTPKIVDVRDIGSSVVVQYERGTTYTFNKYNDGKSNPTKSGKTIIDGRVKEFLDGRIKTGADMVLEVGTLTDTMGSDASQMEDVTTDSFTWIGKVAMQISRKGTDAFTSMKPVKEYKDGGEYGVVDVSSPLVMIGGSSLLNIENALGLQGELVRLHKLLSNKSTILDGLDTARAVAGYIPTKGVSDIPGALGAVIAKRLEEAGYDSIAILDSANALQSIRVYNKDAVVEKMDAAEAKAYTEAYISDTVYEEFLGNVEANKYSKIERLSKDMHKSAEAVSSLMDIIQSNDPNKTSDKHLSKIKGMMQDMLWDKLPELSLAVEKEADKTGGVFNISRAGVKGNPSITVRIMDKFARDPLGMSGAEALAHEYWHAYTEYALRSNDAAIRQQVRQMRRIMDHAMKQIKPEHLIAEGVAVDELSMEAAKERWNYVFANKNGNGLSEFIAYSMSNEAMMKQLESMKLGNAMNVERKNESLLETLLSIVRKVMAFITGDIKLAEKDNTVMDKVTTLVHSIAVYNRGALKEARENESAVDVVFRMLRVADDMAKGKIDKGIEMLAKLLPEGVSLPANNSMWEKAKFFAAISGKVMFDSKLRTVYENVLAELGMSPSGWVQGFLRDVATPDELERKTEELGRMSDMRDRHRNSMKSVTAGNLREGFKTVPTKYQQALMTEVLLDTDIQVLLADSEGKNGYSNKELRSLLEDSEKLDAEIKRYKDDVYKTHGTVKGKAEFYSTQAAGLGYYLATHKAHAAQNLNAYNIAKGYLTDGTWKTDAATVNMIDRLATLYGLKYTNSAKRKAMAEYMKVEHTGIYNMLRVAEMQRIEAKSRLFAGSESLMVKGHTKELFDDGIDIQTAPVSKEAELAQAGYKLMFKVPSNSGYAGSDMAVYKADTNVSVGWYRSNTRLTGFNRKGTSLTEIRFKENSTTASRQAYIDKRKVDRVRSKIVKSMMDGTFDPTKVDYGWAPLMNAHGAVVDYRYMMTKENKRDLLGQDTSAIRVLAETAASNIDKIDTIKQNEEVWKVMEADQRANYIPNHMIGKNDKRYVVIDGDSSDERLREIYMVMPQEFREKAKEMPGGKLAVREDMLINYFGFRHYSVLHQKWAQNLYPTVKRAIAMTEDIWQAIVAIAKSNILIRVPMVLANNILSNIVYAVVSGTPLSEVYKQYMSSVIDVKDYMRQHHELMQLELAAKTKGNPTKQDTVRINKLREDLKANPIHELMEAGIYQSVVEDTSLQDVRQNNRVTNWVKDKMEAHTPEWVQTAAGWMYLSENTGYYKFMHEATQLSDLVARAVMNKRLIEKGVGKKDRHERIMDAFVNYNKPSTSFEEYLNRMGIVMFTKYAKRILRTIMDQSKRSPVSVTLALLGQEWMYDVPDITDSSPLATNSIEKLFHFNPVDYAESVVTPHGVSILLGKID